MGNDPVKHMANRFLMWRLPENFHPDAGISFNPEFNVEHNASRGKPPQRHNPVGTNLFDADQAEAMVSYMLEGLPTPTESSIVPDDEGLDKLVGLITEFAVMELDADEENSAQLDGFHRRTEQAIRAHILALTRALADERKRVGELEAAVEPFIQAGKRGVATYEAVKAANLREKGLSSYETIYVGAGTFAAESNVCFADWKLIASLSKPLSDGAKP